MRYPTAEEVLSGDDRSCLFQAKRSLRSILPLIFGFFFSALCVYYVILRLEDSQWLLTLPLIKHISPRWLGLIPAFFLLELLRRQYDDLYIFSDNRIQHKAGRLSLNYRVPSIKFVDIRSIRVIQSVWGRILGYGDVELGTSAQSETELSLLGMLAPRELAQLIDDIRSQVETSNPETRSAD